MAEKVIYFGHPINTYNSTQEDFLMNAISKNFSDSLIENPNQWKHQEGYLRLRDTKGKRGMDYYFGEVLPKMGAGVFLSFEDGMLGAGVYGEADFLSGLGKGIYEIDSAGNILDLRLDSKRFLSIDETRKRVYSKMWKVVNSEGSIIESPIRGKYAGWNKGIFGRLDCRSGTRMKKENRVFFRYLEEAVLAGYRPCKNCRPIGEVDFERIKKFVLEKNLEEFYNRRVC